MPASYEKGYPYPGYPPRASPLPPPYKGYAPSLSPFREFQCRPATKSPRFRPESSYVPFRAPPQTEAKRLPRGEPVPEPLEARRECSH
jgi:hypothetical protein